MTEDESRGRYRLLAQTLGGTPRCANESDETPPKEDEGVRERLEHEEKETAERREEIELRAELKLLQMSMAIMLDLTYRFEAANDEEGKRKMNERYDRFLAEQKEKRWCEPRELEQTVMARRRKRSSR